MSYIQPTYVSWKKITDLIHDTKSVTSLKLDSLMTDIQERTITCNCIWYNQGNPQILVSKHVRYVVVQFLIYHNLINLKDF